MSSAKQIDRNCAASTAQSWRSQVHVAEVVLSQRRCHQCAASGNGKVHDPRDRETEHSEEHSRADRPGGRLPREASAALRVDPERDEERDLREHPVDVEEPLVPLRTLDEVGAEDRVDVDRPEHERVRNGGRVEEIRSGRERHGAERDEGDPQKVSPRTGVGKSTSSSGSGSVWRRTGAAYG